MVVFVKDEFMARGEAMKNHSVEWVRFKKKLSAGLEPEKTEI